MGPMNISPHHRKPSLRQIPTLKDDMENPTSLIGLYLPIFKLEPELTADPLSQDLKMTSQPRPIRARRAGQGQKPKLLA